MSQKDRFSYSLLPFLATNPKTNMTTTIHSGPRRVSTTQISSMTVFILVAFVTQVALGYGPQEQPAQTSQQKPIGEANRILPERLAEGWISLFDGESLFGWKARTKTDWQVSEGTIKATQGETGLLTTTSQFSDYELRVEYKCDGQTNSGVFLRTSPNPKNAGKDCYEINIAPPEHPFPTGGVVDRQKIKPPAKPNDRWNQLRMIVDGDRGQVYFNGELVNEFAAGDLGLGYIGLQFRKDEVQFRNIFLKPLRLKPMLGATGLDQWNTDQSRESTFTIDGDKNLHMQSGPGQLESKQHFANFVLGAKIKTNAPGLNSGIFFRCVPSEKMNGYESQIQNQMIDGDPTKPVDCGTGGIFRRANARRIVAEDEKWFYKTIVAQGPHVSVWVNGFQVTDWTDKRKPDANPRRGLRLEAGSIMLQGHDPTTDILIQEINAAELRPRRPRRP
jgi:hypothetical protein